jgi:Flp pilus assembly pilin Flp
MMKIGKLIRRSWVDTHGATAIEYAMIASVVALVLVLVLPGLSGAVGALFSTVSSAF